MAALGAVILRTDSNVTNDTQIHASDEHHQGSTVLFLFLAFAVGAAVRHLLKRTPLPYTVVLIVVGLIIGSMPKWKVLKFMQKYLTVAEMDPHLMLIIFLPTLIFESAFVMDVHTFKKTIGQSITLAGPGLIFSTFLTSLMGKFIFTYNWSWVVALMFGTILSATDPVAVVALLKELGASKQLGTIIEGESLLNDGAAIVLFNVFKDELIPGQGRNGVEIFLYFLQVAIGGPVFGYIMAKATIFWLSRVFNDALVEIAITLASTYVTFYIGEELLHVSGVLAVVTLGIEINSRKTNISPEVEVFLHRFWEVLGYLANTVIFLLVGVVISQRAFQDVDHHKDWIFVIALYLGIMVIRLIVNGCLYPILTRIGYTVTWKHVIVITWGGLRGAVGLALALVVAQTTAIDFDTIGSKVLFHTAGIVILTLVVNATTTKYLLKALGMSDISAARQKTMSSAVGRVNDAKQRAMSMLKSDRFLADANWDIVSKTACIDDPYKHLDISEFPQDSFLAKSLISHCPQCEIEVPRVPNRKELAELAEEVRSRMIKAEKTSYWRQFEHGMLSRESVRVLTNLADTVMDTPDRLISLVDLVPHWKIPKIFVKIRHLINWAVEWKSSDQYPPPTNKCVRVYYLIALHPVFEWTLFGIIVFNVFCSIIEFSVKHEKVQEVLEVFNYLFCICYLIEAIIKMIGLRKYYWLSKWNLFDVFILVISVVDIALGLSLPNNNSKFSPAVFRVIRILRILRVGRVLRLLKMCLPKMVIIVDYFVNRRLRFGYDIGRGFVVGEEELLQRFDRFKQVHKEVAEEMKTRVEKTRLDVIRSLGLIRKEHPGVALSVKTHQATRSVLNHCQDVTKQILSNGLLDEIDADKILQIIETKIKRLENTQVSLPSPDPDDIFCNLHWLNGLDSDVISSLRTHAEVSQYDTGDYIIKEGEDGTGIYIIISGLVKVIEIADITTDNSIIDFFGAGSVIGEMAVLKEDVRNASVICETDVQVFYINKTNLQKVMIEYPILEEKLWRVCGIRIAVQILAKLPQYQEWPTSKLSLMCESSYVVYAPEGPVPTFEVTDQHKEVIVISGEVRCVSTRENLISPCVIPKTVKNVLMNVGSPKLLVITTVLSSDKTNGEELSNNALTNRPSKMETLRIILHTCLVMVTACINKAKCSLSRCKLCKRNRISPAKNINKDNKQVLEKETSDSIQKEVVTPVISLPDNSISSDNQVE